MKQNLLNKLWLRGLMLVALMCTAFTGAWADKITDYNDIVSGKKYYIGATVSETDYYFYADGSSTGTGVQGTSKTDKAEASVLVFEGNGASWTIRFDGTNNYLSLASSKANGKVNVVEDAVSWTVSNVSGLIQLKINNYLLQKNSSTSLNFGSYQSGQKNVWLEEVPEASPLASIALSGSYPTTFHQGDAFSHEGITVTATYENTSTKDVTDNATFSGYDMAEAGEQTVTVSYTEGDVTKTTEYTITVNAPATLTSITLSGTYPTEFTQGEEFSSEGIEVTANFDDETTSDVTGEATFEGYDMSMVGEQEITVSYGGKTATYTITVNEYVMPSELVIDFESALSTYKEWTFENIGTTNTAIAAHGGSKYGANINDSGNGVSTCSITTKNKVNPETITFYISKCSNNTTASSWSVEVSADGSEWTTVDGTESAQSMSKGTWNEVTRNLSTYSNVYVRISYGSSNAIRAIDDITLEMATPKALSYIALSGTYPTTFHVGDAFSHEGMTVTATYEGGKTVDVTTSATFSGYDMSTAGVQTVTVSYTENEVTETATYDITVNAPATLTSITLSGTYPTEFEQGDAFSYEGIVVTANYDDETTKNVTEDATFEGYDMSTLGEQTVTVTYEDKTTTYNITVVEKKGTAENPYTVAQARAAIDAGTGITGVYATGIVSEIVTAYNSQYGNISYNISADGTTTSDQLQAYRGKSYNGEWFTSADDIQVGDVVVVYGNLKKYSSTYEFDADNQLVSLDRPVVTTPSISLGDNEINAYAGGTDGVIIVDYKNITNVVAKVFFCDAEGNAATYDWVTASINNIGNLVYVIDANESTEGRTAYMKVYALDDDTNDVYSDLITITQAGYVVDYATLPFEFDGGRNNISSTVGLTYDGLGSDYGSSPKMKFDGTGDELVLKLNEEPGVLFFDIKGNSFSGGTFTVQTSTDGETYANLKKYTTFSANVVDQKQAFSLNSDVRYIKWVYTEKASGNVALGNIIVDVAQVATVGAAGYATYVPKYNVSFPEGVEAYITSEVNTEKGYVSMTQVAAVPKGTPVVLKNEGEYVLAPAAADALADVNGNHLKVSDGTVKGNGSIYVLAKPENEEVGFYLVSDGSAVTEGKAYLEIANADVKAFYFAFGDEATSINEELRMKSEESAAIYNLAGQRIQKMQRGINIVNGKKVLK